MNKINYLKGDATRPVGNGNKIICHVCNDVGAWGAGFVLAISKRWKEPEKAYRAMKTRVLGTTEIVPVEDDISVANMIGQHDIRPDEHGNPPIRYAAIRAALAAVNDHAYRNGCTLHMPRIGCGLAGGNWNEIEKILREVASVEVYVYDFE